jgi:hypothetical protein
MMEISLQSAQRLPLPMDVEQMLSEVSAQECSPPSGLGPGEHHQEQLDWLLLIEMRYQQYLAQRALQDLFEEGALQGLEG